MQGIDLHEFDNLTRSIDKLIASGKEEKRKVLDRCGEIALSELQKNIGLRVNDKNRKIRSFQELRKGSKGGYVAISPIKGETGADSPGAITNYLEGGHRTREAKLYRKRKTPKKLYVKGYFFYEDTRADLEDKVVNEFENLADKLSEVI